MSLWSAVSTSPNCTGAAVWVVGIVLPLASLGDDGDPGLTSTKKLPSRNTRGRIFIVASSWMGSADFFISMVTIAAPSPLPPSSTASTFLTLPTSTPAIRTGELGLMLLAVSNAPLSS